jgi:heme oxygenase
LTSPALAALRDATYPLHAELDQRSPLTHANLGTDDYVAYAARVLGWMRPLEARLSGIAWPADLQAEQRWHKSAWLSEDLRAAGWQTERIEALDDCTQLPAPTSLAAALGVAYVAEGATLGGAFLYQRLSERLAPSPLRWLQGYGEATGSLWRGFQQSLAAHVTDKQAIRQAQDGARAAFISFRDWTAG